MAWLAPRRIFIPHSLNFNMYMAQSKRTYSPNLLLPLPRLALDIPQTAKRTFTHWAHVLEHIEKSKYSSGRASIGVFEDLAQRVHPERILDLIQLAESQNSSQEEMSFLVYRLLDILVKQLNFREALKLYRFTQKYPHTENAGNIKWIFNNAAKSISKIDDALEIAMGLPAGQQPDIVNGERLIRALCQTGRPGDAFRVWNHFLTNGAVCFAADRTLVLLVRGFLEANNFNGLFGVLEIAKLLQIAVQPDTLVMIVRGLSSDGRTEAANNWLSLLRDPSQKKMSIEIFNAFLAGSLKNITIMGPISTFKAKLEKEGLAANDLTREILIEQYLERGDIKNAQIVFEDVDNPNSKMYGYFLKHYTLINDWDSINSTWNLLLNMRIDDSAMKCMLQASMQRNDTDTIQTIFSRLRPLSHPNTHRLLVTYFLSKGRFDKCSHLLHMIPKWHPKGVHIIADLINHYASKGDLARAENYVPWMCSFGGNITYHGSRGIVPLIRGYAKYQKSKEKVEHWWKFMRRKGMKIDHRAYASLMGAYSDLGNYAGALQLLKDFEATGSKASLEMRMIEMVVYGRLGRTNEVERIYRAISSKRLSHSQSLWALNALMTGYGHAGQWQQALNIWKKVYRTPMNKGDTFGISDVTVSIIIDALSASGKFAQVEAIWTNLIANEFPLVENNYTSFMEALIRDGKEAEAIGLVFTTMPDAGIRPGVKTLRNLVEMISSPKLLEWLEEEFQLVPSPKPHITGVFANAPQNLPERTMPLAPPISDLVRKLVDCK